MIKLVTTCTLLITISVFTKAQTVYMPRNVEDAYKKGTRSADGKPTARYWQNYGRYDISVTAAPPDRTIKGTEDITYVNNSTDTLNNLVIKLILNIHRPGALRYGDAGDAYLTAGTQIDALTINGKPAAWNDPEGHVTWQGIALPTALFGLSPAHLSSSARA